jgi:Transposase
MSSSYRDAFFPSGAKDDNGDTLLLLDLLRHRRDRLPPCNRTPLTHGCSVSRTEDRRALVEQKVSVVQQLTDCVAQYFPQVRAWFGP